MDFRLAVGATLVCCMGADEALLRSNASMPLDMLRLWNCLGAKCGSYLALRLGHEHWYQYHRFVWLMHKPVLLQVLLMQPPFAYECKPGPFCHDSIMPLYKFQIVNGAACNLHIVQRWLSVKELCCCDLWAFYFFTLNPRPDVV